MNFARDKRAMGPVDPDSEFIGPDFSGWRSVIWESEARRARSSAANHLVIAVRGILYIVFLSIPPAALALLALLSFWSKR